MNKRKLRVVFPSSQIVLILMGILVLYLAVDFGRQVIISQQYKARLLAVQAKKAAASDRQAALQDQYEYIQSDKAPSDWGRNLGWAKPNEVPVVIVAPDEASGSASPSDAGSVPPDGNLNEWWELFFGAR
jgi:hypothetical protein